MKNKRALLVIDMQKGSFTPKTPRFDANGIVKRINGLAELFRQMNLPVVFVQHDGNGSGEFEKNTRAWELLDELHVRSTDIYLDKYANDIFYHSELHKKLMELEVTELLITGCATDFCVESSIQSALTKDYTITVVSDGHTTAERPHLKAEKVIEHYNWVWQNMIPTKGTIKVEPYEQILKTLTGSNL